jgi:hypothetical protein
MEKSFQATNTLIQMKFSYLITSTLRLTMCMSYKAQRI